MDPKLYEAAMKGDLDFLSTMGTDQRSNILSSSLTPADNTVLHVATQFNQKQFARSILNDCPLLFRHANSDGDTALHVAAKNGFPTMLEILINHAKDSDVNDGSTGQQQLETHKEFVRTVNKDYDTALHCAARNGYLKSMELLMEADPESCSVANNANESLLYIAAVTGVPRAVEIIMDAAPPSALHTGPNGFTALHIAISFSKFLDVIENMIKWRPEMIKERDILGWTPLHYAARRGGVEQVGLLLKYDDSAVYILDEDGNSALHIAAYRGHMEIMKELIKCRPDCVDLSNTKGQTALHLAVLGKREHAVKYILQILRFASLINKPDDDGNTPLHLAALHRLYDIIFILTRDKKTDINFENKEHLTVANIINDHLERGGRAENVRYLLRGTLHGAYSLQHWVEEDKKKMNMIKPTVERMSSSASVPVRSADHNLDHGKKGAEIDLNLGFDVCSCFRDQ